MVIGIDASRNRSGGANGHLVGILSELNPIKYGISFVHVWSYNSLLGALPEYPWLIKHNPPELERSLLSQVWWQFLKLPVEAKRLDVSILLNTDAGTIGNFHPNVVMSRDMLSYEKNEMQRFGISRARLRLLMLKYIQARSLKCANGVIFLTNHAAKVIQEFTGNLNDYKVIPHGIGENFRQKNASGGDWPEAESFEIRCIYISNTSMYKHQWHVVKAVGNLKGKGYNITLLLVGGGKGRAQNILNKEILETDPTGKFIRQIDFVDHEIIPKLLSDSHIFIFASSCENMPNTLVEGMAAGIPIACSNRGPMPEVLQDAGVYFDPENPEMISKAIELIITKKSLRKSIAQRAKDLSEQYSWSRCADETFKYLVEIQENNRI